MTMNDPIADMLTRIRNGSHAGHRRVDIPLSKIKIEIARILAEHHFIQDFKVIDDHEHGLLRVYLKYTDEDRPVIRSIQRISKPGYRRYAPADEVPKIRSGLGIAIMSTSRGVLSDREARKQRLGGEILAAIY